MSNTNTGGPAFSYGTAYAGMTLRDYFAAKAMQGLMSRKEQGGFDFAVSEKDAMRVAMWAYALADEMLKAREA
jgi:hypothetical protein